MNYALENYNIARDARSQGPAERPVLYLEDEEIELPMHWEVCPVCEGEGHHVNPAIDAGGLSEEMMDDEEFLDGYQSGVYDVPCNRCEGKRVVPGVDWDALPPEHRKAYEAQLRADWEDEQERLSEIRMGC